MFWCRPTTYGHFLRYLSKKKLPLKKIYETKIIPPLKRKKISRSTGPIKTTFELYKESKLPFYLRAPYLRKKAILDVKYAICMKLRGKNAFQLYKGRGQIRIHSQSVRARDFDRGWFCFAPPNPETEDMTKYFYKDRKEYENFINDNSENKYQYPCCTEFSKVQKNCEIFREKRPGRCGIKVIDRFFRRSDLLIQPANAQHILSETLYDKKNK